MDKQPQPDQSGMTLRPKADGRWEYVDATPSEQVDGRRRYYAAIMHVVDKHVETKGDIEFFNEMFDVAKTLESDRVVVNAAFQHGITRGDAPVHSKRYTMDAKRELSPEDVQRHVFRTIMCVDAKVLRGARRAAQGYSSDLVGK